MAASAKQRRKSSLAGSLLALLLLALVPLALFAVSQLADKAIPENPITGEQEAFAVSPMLVSPESTKQNEGQSDQDPDDDPDEEEPEEEPEEQTQEEEQQSETEVSYTGGSGTPEGEGSGGNSPAEGGGTSRRPGTQEDPNANTGPTSPDTPEPGTKPDPTSPEDPEDPDDSEDPGDSDDPKDSEDPKQPDPKDPEDPEEPDPEGPEEPEDPGPETPEGDNRPTLVIYDEAGNELQDGAVIPLTSEHYTLRVLARDGNGKNDALTPGSVDFVEHPEGSTPALIEQRTDGTIVYDISFANAINYVNPDANGVFTFTYAINATNASKPHLTLEQPKRVTFTYEYHAEGEYLGAAYVNIDLSALGATYYADNIEVPLYAKTPFSQSFEQVMEEDYGYKVQSSGLKDAEGKVYNYYIAGIEMPTNTLSVDPILHAMLEVGNRYTFAGTTTAANGLLRDNDFVAGSGWMIAKNGQMIGKTLNDENISNGDQITFVFSLAGGADITTNTSATVSGTTLCGTWYGGVDIHHENEGTWTVHEITAATCTEPATVCNVCPREYAYYDPNRSFEWHYDIWSRAGACSEIYETSALGHDYQLIAKDTIEPIYDEDPESPTYGQLLEKGRLYYRCSRCNDERIEEFGD